MARSDRYRAAAPDTLRTVALDSMTAIYHRPSARTHVVASPVPEILGALADEPLDLDALLARLAERYDLRDPDRQALAARLDELAETGLVARA